MLIREIMTSCSNDSVAQAALASIGGAFAARIEARADGQGLRAGQLAAEAVRQFSAGALARDIEGLRTAISGHDQPVLAGLRHILEAAIQREDMDTGQDQRALPKAVAGLSARRAPCPGIFCHTAL